MPPAATSPRTATSAESTSASRVEEAIGTFASNRLADPTACPGQLKPNPFGITTSNRPLYTADSSNPRNRAYTRGSRHSAVIDPKS